MTVMTRTVVLIAVAGTTACASTPLASPEPQPAIGTHDTAFGCGMRLLNELEYTVIDADRDAGFIRAEQNVTGVAAALSRQQNFNVLTFTVYEDDEPQTMVRVAPTAYRVSLRSTSSGQVRQIPVTDDGAQDARTILRTCGEQSPRN